MTHINTAGSESCATIAIAGFGMKNGIDHYVLNTKYEEDPKSYNENGHQGHTVWSFYDEVLFPVSQPLGKTKDYPFDLLMKNIDNSFLKSKCIFAVLNSHQFKNHDYYWPAKLKEHGFKLVDKCANDIGSTNYIFIRNEVNKVGITEEEEQWK